MKAKKAECRKAITGEFLLADVAVALGIAHVKALGELEALLDVCPNLSVDVEPVMAHPSRGGRWEETYIMSAGVLFAFLGFIGIRDRTKLIHGVFAHPKRFVVNDDSTVQGLPQGEDKKEGE